MNTHATAASMMRAARDGLPCRLLTDGELAEIMPPQQYRCIPINRPMSRYQSWLLDALCNGTICAAFMAGVFMSICAYAVSP